MNAVYCVLLLCAATCATLVVTSGHVHGEAPRKYLGKEDTLAAIREARIDMHAYNPLLGDDMSSWSPLDLPPNEFMNLVVTLIEGIDALSNDTSPTPIERLTDILGSLVIFVRNVRMALDSNGQSSGCNTCMLGAKLLKAMALVVPWEQLAPIVTTGCVPIVLPSVGGLVENALELCKITDLQGPHLYAAFGNPSILPRTHCIYYGRCPGPSSDDNDLETGLPDTELPTLPARRGYRKPKQQAKRRMRNLEDAIRVVQMSDIHVDLTYTIGNEGDCGLPVCCFEDLGLREGASPAGRWSHYNCNPPQWTVDLMLQKAYEHSPDFMLYSGDTPSNIMWRETFDGQMNCSRALTEAIARNMPGVPAFPAIGNHETFPGNQYYMGLDETKMMNQKFLDWWGPVANFNGDNNITMLESGYFAKEVKPGLVVVSFNNIYWFADNWYAPIANAEVPAANNYVKVMQRWTLNVMDAARARGDKVIFMSHIAAGSGPWHHTKWLTNLNVQYSDIIVLWVSGHSHSNQFRIVRDPVTYEPKGVSLIAGAVSTMGTKNPIFRLYYLDPDSFQVMDYDQYLFDIDANFDAETPVVERSYRASEEYGLEAITGEEYDKLVTRMEHDPSLHNKYYYNYYTRRPGTNPELCSDLECMYGRLCQLSHANPDHRSACNARELPISPMVPTTTTLPPCATQATTTPTTPPDETGAAAAANFQNLYILMIFVAGMLIN